MTITFLPIWLVDIGGSIGVIVFAWLSLMTSYRLKQRDSGNIVWAYLFWVCVAMSVFSLSRSTGHIVKQVFILSDQARLWEAISPYSGAVNTIAFIVVGSVTLFFERTWVIYQQMQKDQSQLQETHNRILYMNQNLEKLVEQRTKELTESEYKYRRIFEVSRDIIIVTSEDGKIIDINPSGSMFFGIPSEGKGRFAALPEYLVSRKDWEQALHTLREKGFIVGRELDIRDKCGDSRRAILSASLMGADGDNGETIHFLIKDIEQQRRLREQMAQADKLASIGELSSGIAHEINNPLGIILGYTQLMLRGENEQTQKHADLKTIEKHVQSCKTIVEDLLNFARRSETRKSMASLNHVVREVVGFMKQHGNMSSVRIQEEYDPELKDLFIDEKKIKQVFINLIMNASHAVGYHGRITIRTRMCSGGRNVKVDVQDDGYGIEGKNIRRIFDPFFTTKPTGEGTGLGLSVSYGIIRNHGGDITVKSDPGKGTVFTIELPVQVQNKEKDIESNHSGC